MSHRSLFGKLLIAFLVMTSTIIAIVAISATFISRAQFISYMDRENKAKLETLASFLSDYYERQNGWYGIEEFFENHDTPMSGSHMMGQMMGRGMMMNPVFMSGLSGYRVILADADGAVVADTGKDNIEKVPKKDLANGQPVQIENGTIAGYLLIGSKDTALLSDFTSKINRALLASGAAAMILAVAFGIYMSRRITVPISRISEKTKSVASGRFNERVPVDKYSAEIELLGRSFNTMAEELQRGEEAKKRLIADIAHELRTPLTVIQGNLEAMADGVLPVTEERLSALNEKCVMLNRLIDDLKTLSLAEAGGLRITKKPVKVCRLLQMVQETFEHQIKIKGNELRIDCDKGLDEIAVDGPRIVQVLINLVANANNYTERGHISITANISADGRQAEFEVRDTGSGISENDLGHVFDRFWRAENSRNREFGGSGLGLAIAKEIIRLHGGTIQAASEPGEGSIFRFNLPRDS